MISKKQRALSIGFFNNDDELDTAEESLKEKKTNYFKKAKGLFKQLVMLLVSLAILYSFLGILGLEES